MVGTEVAAQASPSIVVEYKNERPIELLDLTASLTAFGEEFKHFTADQGDIVSSSRLYVHQMRVGSIIAELIPWLEQIDFVLKHRDTVAGFMANWQETLQAILNLNDRARELPKPALRHARSFVQPIARDNGSQVNIIATDGGTVINNIVTINSSEAEAIVRNAGYLLGRKVPTEEPFEFEPMTLYQMRDARAGDMGFIDRFTTKPVKLTFASEETKHSILHHDGNPWDMIFFVSGVVKTAGGAVAAYHIRRLDDVAPRDAA